VVVNGDRFWLAVGQPQPRYSDIAGGSRKAAGFHLISDADTARNNGLLLVKVP
jgi:hypothetical protein